MQKISVKPLAVCICLLLGMQNAFSQEKVKAEFRKKVKEAANELYVTKPYELAPVNVNARTVWSDDKKHMAVIIKAEVLDNWHIYAFVPPDQPYIVSELRLKETKGLIPVTDWEKPVSYPYDEGVLVYKGSLLFIRYFTVTKDFLYESVEAGLYYQTCDMKQCLPPELTMIKMTL
jgi:hypothetical protein